MTTRIKMHNGTPTPFVDDEPTFASSLWPTAPEPDGYASARVAARFAEAGIHLHALDVGSRGIAVEWCGPRPGQTDHFDFSTLEARLGRVLDADPEARFHFRIHIETRQWWEELYPGECERGTGGERLHQSYASGVWREQAEDFLQRYIAAVKSIGLADRVFAYQVLTGSAGEWVKGESSMKSLCGDFSEPMRRYFRTWLRRLYVDDEALRSAWGDAKVTLETAEVPTAGEQLTTKHHTFRDPTREQKTIDYYRCFADLCAGLVDDFCRTIKRATNDNVLAGVFFGYLMELAWNASFFTDGYESEIATTQRSGHLGLGRILRSPHVDFIVSPYSYGFRGIGGHGAAMPPIDSLRLHGKLYIYEDDTRTHLAPPDVGYGRVKSLSDSEAVLKRNMAEVLTRGMGIWWNGRADHIDADIEPAFRPLLKRFHELGTFATRLDRTPGAEVAVLLDDESFFYESVYNDLDLPLIFQQRLWGLPRMGAPVDTYLLQDLVEGRLPDYKLYIFLNAFRLDQERRAVLARELRRDGRVALWIYAPGYIEEAPGLAHMTDLTGLQFSKGEHPWGPLVHIVDFDHEITRDLTQDLFWGTNSRLGPVFHIEDPKARVLGDAVYSQGRCKPGFGVVEFTDWASVYSAAPNLPASVLRGVARYAGVHLYSDAGDVLYATPELLGVHTVSGGEREFRLPRPAEVVYELFEEREVARNVDRFRVALSPRSTALYYTGGLELISRLGAR